MLWGVRIAIRILAITASHPPYHHGGYELRCKAVLDKLQNRGHDIRIITTRPPNGESQHITDEHIFRVLHRAQGSRGMFRGILDEYLDVTHLDSGVRSFRPDIVYLGHILDLSRAIFPYLAEAGIPVVIDDGGITASWAFTHRGPWYGLIGRKSTSSFKNRAKGVLRESVNWLSHHRLKTAWSWPENISVFFNNPVALERALAEGVTLQSASVIRSGVDTALFTFGHKPLQNDQIEILTPGRIEPKKGTLDAVLLLERLRRKDLQAKLTIVGDPYVADYYNELLEQINALGLQEWVTIVPQVEYHSIPTYYQRADICFFPSYHKTGLSRVPLEAMASGCVIITYGNESSSAIVQHGETGYIVPEGKIEAGADFIHDLVLAPATRERVIRNARQEVEQHHSMDSYVDAIEAFLLNMVEQNKEPDYVARDRVSGSRNRI